MKACREELAAVDLRRVTLARIKRRRATIEQLYAELHSYESTVRVLEYKISMMRKQRQADELR